MAEQDLDRNEAATPFKLEKAKEQGQTARSTDVVNATVFAVAMAFAAWYGLDMVASVFRLARVALVHAGSGVPTATSAWPLATHMLREAGFLVLPFMGALMLAAVVGTVAQTGIVLTTQPLQMDFNRLNPVSGIKRILSLRTLFDGARAIVKLVVLLLAAWYALQSLLPQFYMVAGLPPQAFLRTLVEDATDLGLKMALILAFIAFLDLMYTRREFGRKMRMSRRELNDETKNREGDPRIRARLRELRREALQRSLALRNTRNADVVLTNPTHYAVALRYVHGEMEAPKVVAKGAGQLAARMREIAYRHQIAIVRNPGLARRMFREIEIEQAVPAAFHAEVARIIVWVFAMREQRRGARGAAS